MSPHSLHVTPSRARPPLVKGGQANWRPSLGLWGSASLWVNKPSLHCGGVPLHQRPSLVASLHSEGPSHDCGRGTRFWSRWLACWFTSPEVGVIWFLADGWLGRRPPGPMPQLQGGVRHGLEVSRFPDFWPFWGGMGILPKAALAVLGGTWVWSLGLFSPIFFLHIHKQKKIFSQPHGWVRLGFEVSRFPHFWVGAWHVLSFPGVWSFRAL